MNEHKFNVEIATAHGEGQGSCTVCTSIGKWNRNWMCFLKIIKVDNQCAAGLYCPEHALERASIIDKLLNEEKYNE